MLKLQISVEKETFSNKNFCFLDSQGLTATLLFLLFIIFIYFLLFLLLSGDQSITKYCLAQFEMNDFCKYLLRNELH